jgi:hypothetical protein
VVADSEHSFQGYLQLARPRVMMIPAALTPGLGFSRLRRGICERAPPPQPARRHFRRVQWLDPPPPDEPGVDRLGWAAGL